LEDSAHTKASNLLNTLLWFQYTNYFIFCLFFAFSSSYTK
jgi:hypothetical protein